MGYKVAVVGATGNVGREVLSILEERDFPADEVVALASARSVGTQVALRDAKRPVALTRPGTVSFKRRNSATNPIQEELARVHNHSSPSEIKVIGSVLRSVMPLRIAIGPRPTS